MQSALIILALLFQLPVTDANGERTSTAIHRKAEIWPHPAPPKNLKPTMVDITLVEAKRFLFWTYEDPVHGRIRIEQEREKGGWYICAVRDLDANGHFAGEIPIDATLRNPTVLLVILEDGQGERWHGEMVGKVSGKWTL